MSHYRWIRKDRLEGKRHVAPNVAGQFSAFGRIVEGHGDTGRLRQKKKRMVRAKGLGWILRERRRRDAYLHAIPGKLTPVQRQHKTKAGGP